MFEFFGFGLRFFGYGFRISGILPTHNWDSIFPTDIRASPVILQCDSAHSVPCAATSGRPRARRRAAMPHHRRLLPAPPPPSGGACPAPARVAGADPRKPPNHCRLPHLTRCCAQRPRPPPLPPLLGVASPPSSPEEEPTPPAPRHQGLHLCHQIN